MSYKKTIVFKGMQTMEDDGRRLKTVEDNLIRYVQSIQKSILHIYTDD